MKKFLLAGAAIAFAGIAATVAVASEHKSKPMHHASVVTAKTTVAHKESAPKKHHSPKRHHHAAPKAHTK
jgi:hypothetical protein